MARKSVNREKQNTHAARNNRANQLNPNNDAYRKSREHDKKPSDRNQAPSHGRTRIDKGQSIICAYDVNPSVS